MRKVITSLLIFLLSINILYVISGVLFHPMESQDALGIWMLKAKAIYIEHGFPVKFLHDEKFRYSHQTYPLGLPLILSIPYFLTGGVNEILPSMLYPITYISILILTFLFLRKRKIPVHTSLFFTYIYSMLSPLIGSGGRVLFGGADIFLVLIGWLLLHVLSEEKINRKNIVLSLILVIIASQIKFEGVFLSLVFLFLPVEKRMKLVLLVTSVIPTMLWFFFMSALNVQSDISFSLPGFIELTTKIPIVLFGILKEFINIKNWYIFWFLFFFSPFIPGTVSKYMRNVFLPLFIFILMSHACIYVFSNINVYAYVSSSIDRILFQVSFIPFIYIVEKIINTSVYIKIEKRLIRYID